MTSVPVVRQLVLLVPRLDEAIAEAREFFGFERGIRDPKPMAELGFEHEVFTFGDTFLEICAPLSVESAPGRMAERLGPSGYMVVVQVQDLATLVRRAKERDVEPLFVQDFEGHDISQWHPKQFGTLAEFDQVEPPDTWHFADRIFDNPATSVAKDIAAARVAVDDPEAMAARWAELIDAPVADGTRVVLSGTTVEFVPVPVPVRGRRGLVGFDVVAADLDRVGTEEKFCGVTVRFVASAEEDQP